MASSSAQVATVAYQPPLATGSPTVQSSTTTSTNSGVNYGTSTEQPGNTNVYLYYFIVPYLDAHVLSPPSWRYAYIFWIFIAAIWVFWTVAYQLNRYSIIHSNRALFNSGLVFNFPKALSIRRLIPTRNQSQVRRWYSSNLTLGHLLALLTFTAVLLAVSLVGDDYISPTTCTWGGKCPVQVFNQGPPKTTYASHRLRRTRRSSPAPPLTSYSSLHHPQSQEQEDEEDEQEQQILELTKRDYRHLLLPRASALTLNPGGWAPFNDPLLAAPNYDISRNMWTISSRFGLIAYAAIPLVVSIGLKSWPFNVFAIPFLTNYGFDRSALAHRWVGRLIWVWSTIHTITFSIQLAADYNPYGNMILTDVWKYYRFNWGVVAYLALTITVCFSFNPLRNRYYEFFYCSHVVLSILFLVGCVIHYEPLWAWAVIGLALWGAERAWRLLGWLRLNGFFSNPLGFWSNTPTQMSGFRQKSDAVGASSSAFSTDQQQLHRYPPAPHRTASRFGRLSIRARGLGKVDPSLSQFKFQPKTPSSPLMIPPGFALVQVLPGHTLRLTLKMLKPTQWAIGQYVLLCVPVISWWQTHPYTISSSSLLSDLDSTGHKELVLVLRARQGFTKAFLEHVLIQRENERSKSVEDPNGVLIRCMVSQPLGSSTRASFESYETVLVICGGSGIAFGINALEELCVKIKMNRGENRDKRVRVLRVRLVWIFREYAHLSWVAPALQRCLKEMTNEEVEVDLYVSNSLKRERRVEKAEEKVKQELTEEHTVEESDFLVPPQMIFGAGFRDSSSTIGGSSRPSIESEDLGSQMLAEEEVIGEFTDFDGENRGGSKLEQIVSEKVKREGKRRRTMSMRENGKILKSLMTREAHQQLKRESGLDELLERKEMGIDEEDNLNVDGKIDLNLEERECLKELSEIIKTGRPKLKEIIQSEVEECTGSIIISCCGPDSLNSYLRQFISQQIQNKDNNQKNHRGRIDIYTEDFTY